MILYVFITCESRFENCYTRIIDMMKYLNSSDFIIVKGGNGQAPLYDNENHLLTLDCNDFYEGLPEKVVKTFKYIYENDSKYNYICKLDDDMIIKALLNESELFDYCGKDNYLYNGIRNWHFGKCSKDSIFNTTEYTGDFVPWCLGGFGYVVSKQAIEFIQEDTNYFNEIYEDVYIGKILHKNNIFPNSINNMNKFLYSKDHH